MEEQKWKDADDGAVIVGQVLMSEASLVDSIAQQLEEAEGQRPAMQTAKQIDTKGQQGQKLQSGR